MGETLSTSESKAMTRKMFGLESWFVQLPWDCIKFSIPYQLAGLWSALAKVIHWIVSFGFGHACSTERPQVFCRSRVPNKCEVREREEYG